MAHMEGVEEMKGSVETVEEGEGVGRPRKTEVAKSREALVEEPTHARLLYSIEDNPPWYICLALGLQHFLMMVESTVSIPYLLTPLMCMAATDPARGLIASTIIFVSGIVTLMQTTFGVRLPIVQGGTHGFLSPILAILALLPCPPESEILELGTDDRRDLWQTRMQQVQGAICVAAIFQVLVGFTGAVGALLRWITPLVIVPTITLIGFSLFSVAASKAAAHWGIAALTIVLLILFSQYLGGVGIPWFSCSRGRGVTRSKVYIFKLFPVLLAVAFAWLMCWILTYLEVLPEGNHARTDLRLNMISEAPWFRLPYPCQWGLPVVSVAGVMGVLAGVVASVVESIGDYYACARLSGAPPPPKHAINRGIWMEGLGTVLAGLFGTGSGTTSYSQNVGAIGVTRVGSRRVIQYSAAVMLVCGVIGKVGALFITIPEPIIGGIFCVVFAMITSVGLSNVQFIDLNSSRNLFVLGFSLFFGLALPMWMQLPENASAIATSLPMLDQVLSVLLRTPMFVGGFLGFFLDNTIPGTEEERGLVAWKSMLEMKEGQQEANTVPIDYSCYDLPLGMDRIRRWGWTRFVPVLPTFVGWGAIKRRCAPSSPSNCKV
ncbi:solute carrier family 23 member 1-like isoform X2 [Eriocheir sinensis]|uniref:solute carrier family 23 member 1-like isoform X2 n=1 Tax=Eriocheir sinensis TaxID=95602 RepID=UPI0021CA82CF|nr:solute carrier family 23 member 1-like isoform X2 [Eriocheir sinensis]